MIKPTNAEGELRIDAIYRLVLLHASYAIIVKYCKDEWGVTSSRTVCKYIEKARQRLREFTVPEEQEARRNRIALYEQLLREASEIHKDEDGKVLYFPDFMDLVAIGKRLDKIQGLEITRHEVTGKGGGPFEVKGTPEQRMDERIAALERDLKISRGQGKVSFAPRTKKNKKGAR